MTRLGPGATLCEVRSLSGGVGRRWAAGIVFLLVFLGAASAARAASSVLDVGDHAVVQVWARAQSEVTIRTWERQAIQIESDEEQPQITRRTVAFGTPQNPMSQTIPVMPIRVRDAQGNATTASLPPEDFPYAPDMRTGNHDVVRVVASGGSNVTVTVPATTAILDARILGAGRLKISNYHGGTLFVLSGGGRTTLENVQSAAFVQVLNGRLSAVDSTFDRLRARGNTAAMLFERCRAKQIEVTTRSGPIVFDNGTFDGGLARFESDTGAIAVGLAGPAQISARSQDGRVLGLWDRRPQYEQRSENDATATVAGGGPLVTAVSGRGNVFLYDGSLAARRELPPAWRALRTGFVNNRSEHAAPEAPLTPLGPRRLGPLRKFA